MPPNRPAQRQDTTVKRPDAKLQAHVPKLTDARVIPSPDGSGQAATIKPRPFLQRLIDAANDQGLTDFDFRLLVTMAADAQGEDGVAFGSVARYAMRCGDRTRRGVQKARARLKDAGLLEEPSDHPIGSTDTRRFRINPVGWGPDEDVEKRTAEAAHRNAQAAREAVQLTFDGRAALTAVVPSPAEPEDASATSENNIPKLPNLDTEHDGGGEPPFAPPANGGSPPREREFAPPANRGSPKVVREVVHEEVVAATDAQRTHEAGQQQQQQDAHFRRQGQVGWITTKSREHHVGLNDQPASYPNHPPTVSDPITDTDLAGMDVDALQIIIDRMRSVISAKEEYNRHAAEELHRRREHPPDPEEQQRAEAVRRAKAEQTAEGLGFVKGLDGQWKKRGR